MKQKQPKGQGEKKIPTERTDHKKTFQSWSIMAFSEISKIFQKQNANAWSPTQTSGRKEV